MYFALYGDKRDCGGEIVIGVHWGQKSFWCMAMNTAWTGKRSPAKGAAQGLAEDEILRRLESLGVSMSRERLDELSARSLAAEDLANELYTAKTENGRDLLWVWALLEELWARWFPQRMSREAITDLIDAGEVMDDAEAVPYWLDLFDAVMRWLDRRGETTADDIQKLLGADASFLGWIEDIEVRLHSACDKDAAMRARAICFCEEYLRRFEGEDREVTENVRRTMAEFIQDSGEWKKAEALYQQWLASDPRWGEGWMGYSDLYCFGDDDKVDMARCEELLREGLAVEGVRERHQIQT